MHCMTAVKRCERNNNKQARKLPTAYRNNANILNIRKITAIYKAFFIMDDGKENKRRNKG